MAYDPRVIRAISREARRRYGPGGYTKAERRKIRSAFQTGIVESGLRQLNFGDRDSVGWRQQRSSLYPDAGNLPKSVRNYFNEADQLYRGDSAASLAGRVQRPAAQYLYRYGQHRGEGIRLLRKHVLGRSAPQGGVSPTSRASNASDGLTAPLTAMPAGQSAPLSGIADPAVSARRFLKLPEGGQDVPSSGPPAPNATLSERLRARAVPLSPSPVQTPMQARLGLSPQQRLGPGGLVVGSDYMRDGKLYRWDPVQRRFERPGSGRPLPKPGGGGGSGRGIQGGGGYQATEMIVKNAVRGMSVSNFKRTPGRNAAVGGSPTSDHLTTNRNAYAADVAFGSGRRLARRLGIRGWRPGTYQRFLVTGRGGSRYSVQILERVKGHYDHTHLGVQRVR